MKRYLIITLSLFLLGFYVTYMSSAQAERRSFCNGMLNEGSLEDYKNLAKSQLGEDPDDEEAMCNAILGNKWKGPTPTPSDMNNNLNPIVEQPKEFETMPKNFW